MIMEFEEFKDMHRRPFLQGILENGGLGLTQDGVATIVKKIMVQSDCLTKELWEGGENMRTKMNAFLNGAVNEDAKVLREAGLLDSQYCLNSRGVEVLIHFLLQKNLKEFIAFVKSETEEVEE